MSVMTGRFKNPFKFYLPLFPCNFQIKGLAEPALSLHFLQGEGQDLKSVLGGEGVGLPLKYDTLIF
jgi:hypothetical protein